MELENSTEAAELQSGEQAGAVAPQQQSPDSEGQESVVGSQRNGDFVMVDDVGEDGAEDEGAQPEAEAQPGGAARTVEQKQSREENAAIRAARIRARREAEAEAAAKADERIVSARVPNPYNGNKPFTSLKELEDYGATLREAELAQKARETGRSVAELTEDAENRALLAELRRERAERKAGEAAAAERRAFLARDVLDFVEKYPQFDAAALEALENNAQFRQFCGSRFGHEPLAQLYEDYTALVGRAESAAVARAERKTSRSTGSGAGGGTILSPTQKKALDAWNAEHPEMAMTAKEFLGR